MEYTSYIEGSSYFIRISGKFSFNDHTPFKSFLDTVCTHPEIKNCVFQMHDLDYIDSAGLGMLALGYEEMVKRGIDRMIQGAKGQVKMSLQIAQFNKMYHLVE